MLPSSFDFDRALAATRIDLEEAGNPAYVPAVVHADGGVEPGPVIFSRRDPARQAALRLDAQVAEPVIVIARELDGRRAKFTAYDARMDARLDLRLEVVETTLLQDDPMVGLL